MTYIVGLMKMTQRNITITTGLAIFAMFFGAGNMVFPILLGAHAGHHLLAAWLAFMLSGVGIPFAGLFIMTLYRGDYWKFFNVLSRPIAFLVITFILLIIGPLVGAPRTEDITYHSLAPFLPHGMTQQYIGIIYFLLVFAASYRHEVVVDIIGKLISPMKLTALFILIITGLLTMHRLLPMHQPTLSIFTHSLAVGYGTMDLLAAFFFCHIAYRNIVHKCHRANIQDKQQIQVISLKACGLGAFLIALIYTGFMIAAAGHAQGLIHQPTASLISQLSLEALGDYGTLFVGVCVSLACLGTAIALTVVSTHFLYRTILQRRLPKIICSLLILCWMYGMSMLGFDGIMRIASPILNVLYPALIILCAINLYRALKYKPANY